MPCPKAALAWEMRWTLRIYRDMGIKGLVLLPNDRGGSPHCIVPFRDQMVAHTVQDHAQFGEPVHPPDAFQ